jgi:hypothetical protein
LPKNIDDVRVGVDGIVATGPLNATPPTSATSPLPTGPDGFVDLGYVSEDGVTETTEQNVQKLRAWQNAKVVRSFITEGETVYKLTLIQTTADTIALYYGGSVEADGSIIVNPMSERPIVSFVFDIIDGDEVIRTYAPEAQVTEVGDQVYQNGAPIGYEITISCSVVDNIAGSTAKGSVKKWYSSLATPPGSMGSHPAGTRVPGGFKRLTQHLWFGFV